MPAYHIKTTEIQFAQTTLPPFRIPLSIGPGGWKGKFRMNKHKKTGCLQKTDRFSIFFYLSETDISYLSQIRFEQFATITLS